MLGDTLTLVYPSGDRELNKINQDGYSAEYLKKSATRDTRCLIRHSRTKAGLDRHNVEITERVRETETDPEYFRKCYVVFENHPDDTDNEGVRTMANLLANAVRVDALYGWES